MLFSCIVKLKHSLGLIPAPLEYEILLNIMLIVELSHNLHLYQKNRVIIYYVRHRPNLSQCDRTNVGATLKIEAEGIITKIHAFKFFLNLTAKLQVFWLESLWLFLLFCFL